MILSLDPCIKACGWAVLEREVWPNVGLRPKRICSGTFRPSEAKGSLDRFDQLAAFIDEAICMHTPRDVVIETPDPYQEQNFSSLRFDLRAVGVCEGVAYSSSLTHCDMSAGLGEPARIHRVEVNQWKVSGSKWHTAMQVKAIFGYTPDDDNESDAIGLGAWWLSRQMQPQKTMQPPRR
jgi:Holliday junction resolvasome RuvABC endonuclease subunit